MEIKMLSKVSSVQTSMTLALVIASLAGMSSCKSNPREEAPPKPSAKTQPSTSDDEAGTGDTSAHHRTKKNPPETKVDPQPEPTKVDSPALMMKLYRGKGNSTLPDASSEVAGDWFKKASIGP